MGEGRRERDQQLASVVQALFDAGRHEEFLDHVDLSIQAKEGEIEQMSKMHYEGFVTSVDQLLGVRGNIQDLKERIIEFNTLLQGSAGELLQAHNQMTRYLRILANVSKAQLVSQSCLEILDLAAKVEALFASHKFYSALRIIDKIQILNEPLADNYQFARLLQNSLPDLRNQIKEAVFVGMHDWFVKIRSDSKNVGRIAINQSNQLADGSAMEDPSEAVPSEDLDFNVLDNTDVRIDFTPVYQCLHIYEVLGLKEEFEAYYTENRKKQSDLVLTPNFTLSTEEDIRLFQGYLCDIVGFFIIEQTVMNTTGDDYFQGGFVEELWEIAIMRFKLVFSKQLSDCREAEYLFSIKQHLLNFTFTMESYGFKTLKLMDLMSILAARFIEVMQEKCHERMEKIIEEDKFEQLVVHDEDEHESAAFWVGLDKATHVAFPFSLPFSRMVPECCKVAKWFISQYYGFIQGFPADYGEFDEMLRQGVDSLVTERLVRSLVEIVERPAHVNVSQSVQILTNLGAFEDSVPQLEKIIAETRRTHKGISMRLKATARIHDSIGKVKDLTCRQIHQKINDFVDFPEIDGMPSSVQHEASPSLHDLTAYLGTLFESILSPVPSDLRNIFYLSVFEYLAQSYWDLVVKRLKRFNPHFVENLHRDLLFLQTYATTLPLPNLANMFEEISQLVLLLRSDKIEEILDDRVRAHRYSLLKSPDILAVLEKFQTSSSFSFKKSDKKKAIELVLKTLKP